MMLIHPGPSILLDPVLDKTVVHDSKTLNMTAGLKYVDTWFCTYWPGIVVRRLTP